MKILFTLFDPFDVIMRTESELNFHYCTKPRYGRNNWTNEETWLRNFQGKVNAVIDFAVIVNKQNFIIDTVSGVDH